jgi:hypothetical protein
MIQHAWERFTHIAPCPTRETLEDCFTVENNYIMFWFNTDDQSTHVITEKLA